MCAIKELPTLKIQGLAEGEDPPEGSTKLNVTPEEINKLDWNKHITYLIEKKAQMSKYIPMFQVLGGRVLDYKGIGSKMAIQGVVICASHVKIQQNPAYMRVYGGHGTGDKIQHPFRGRERWSTYDYYFSSGAKFEWMMKYSGHILDKPYDKVVKIGDPRTDPWVNGYDEKWSLKNAGIEKKTKPILLVAPTFNSGAFNGMIRLLKKDVCKEYHVIIRPHYLERKRFNAEALKEHDIHINAGGDISHVLYMADALISDESSVLYYFAASGRPIVIKMGVKASFIQGPKKFSIRHRVPHYKEGSLLKVLDEAKKPKYINSVKEMMERSYYPVDGKAAYRMVEWTKSMVALGLHTKNEMLRKMEEENESDTLRSGSERDGSGDNAEPVG